MHYIKNLILLHHKRVINAMILKIINNHNYSCCPTLDTVSKLKSHYRLHAMSVWLNLIPRLHRAGADNSFPQHNKFRGHDDPSLFKGVVRPMTFSHGYQVHFDFHYNIYLIFPADVY